MSGLRMMSINREKICKDKHGFIEMVANTVCCIWVLLPKNTQAYFCDRYHGALSLWYIKCTKGKEVCESPFAVRRHQIENKQNVNVAPLEKFLRTPMAPKGR